MADKASTPGGPNLRPAAVKTIRKRLADGTERAYYYHRKTGRPIKGEPGTPGFLAAYRDAAQPRATAPRLDLRCGVTRYQASPEWAALAKTTQGNYWRYLDYFVARLEGALLEWFDDERMIGTLYEARDEMKKTPGLADTRFVALSALFTWLKRRRYVHHNWVREVERLRPSNQSRAELIWEPEMWERLLGRAYEDERRLLWFARYSAARREDICQMKRADFDGKWLRFTPQKTAKKGIVVQLPVYALPPFAALMEEILAIAGESDRLLLTSLGRPWTGKTIDTRMQRLKVRAFPDGAPDRTFHDIRGTTATDLYRCGCSEAEVGSITGHTIAGGMLERYAARTRDLPLNAYNRWCAARFSGGAQIVEFRR